MRSDILEPMQWRYATKKYDSAKMVSSDDLEILKEAVRLSVSSLGLQPYRVLVIQEDSLRNELRKLAYNQSAVTDASHLFVFAVEKNIGANEISRYLENISQTRQTSLESLDEFSKMMHTFVGGLSVQAKDTWIRKQAYIALTTLINTAAMLKIDATPMEGFHADGFDQVLNLNPLGLTTAVIAAVGYRHEDDQSQHLKKVRKSHEDLFIHL
jgi:nitroreductase